MNSEICTKHFYAYNEVVSGIAVVKNYIQRTGQILVGGQSIDYALRLKGYKLYEDWELPDLDFQTDNHANVAYELFIEVATKQGDSVDTSVINALHHTTMRVQVMKFAVADITFIPTRIIEMYRETALAYDGCLIRHPFFQYLDIQRSFSYPYENPMLEVITHRWAKDFKRFLLTMKYYSPSDKTLVNNFVKMYDLKEKPGLAKLGKKKNRLGKATMFKGVLESNSGSGILGLYKTIDNSQLEKPLSLIGVVNGELAYRIYRSLYKKILGKPIESKYILGENYLGNVYFLNSYLMNLEDKDKFFAKNPKLMQNVKNTNPYIDIIPSRTITEGYEIINVSHRTSYHDINLSKIDPKFPNITIKVVSINFLTLYISMLWITLRSSIYLSMYLKLIKMMEKIYSSTINHENIYLLMPSINTYGTELPHIFDINKLQFAKPENIFINKYNNIQSAKNKVKPYEYPDIYNLDGM